MSRSSCLVDFRTDTLLFLHYAGDENCRSPCSGKPTEFSTSSSIRQACLRTTPFSHAFRPRFPATPKPRLSATSFSHAFRPCLPTCHSDRGRCALPQQCFKLTNLSDTFILDLIDDAINKNERTITHSHIANRVFLQDANIPSHTTQVT